MDKYPEFKFSNIPIFNLLSRFISLYNDFHKQEIIDYFNTHSHRILNDKRFHFFQFSNEFFTFVLRNLIMYFESYLRYSIWYNANINSNKEVLRLLKNPSQIDRQIAKVAFHSLPEKLNPKFSLQRCNKSLYDYMLQFYTKFRNPLFHGDQLNPGTKVQDIIKILELYKELYIWISNWTLADWILSEDEKNDLDLIERKQAK